MRTTEPPKDCWFVRYGWTSGSTHSSEQRFFTSHQDLERWLLDSLLILESSKNDNNHFRWLSQIWLRHKKSETNNSKISGIYGIWHLEGSDWILQTAAVRPPGVSIEKAPA